MLKLKQWQVNYKLNHKNSDISGRLYKKLNINVNIGDIHVCCSSDESESVKISRRRRNGVDGCFQTNPRETIIFS